MRLRTKSEREAYFDGFERYAECVKHYLSDEDKKKLECFLMAVRNAKESEDKDGTVEVVIKIPKFDYEQIKHGWNSNIQTKIGIDAIRNGKLIDAKNCTITIVKNDKPHLDGINSSSTFIDEFIKGEEDEKDIN